MPTEEGIRTAYLEYYTHSPDAFTDSPGRRFRRLFRRAYLRKKLGYHQETRSNWDRLFGPLSILLAFLRPAGPDEVKSKVAYLRALAPSMRLLEIGCGNGGQLASLTEFGWEAVGVDTDPFAVRIARERGLDVREGQLGVQGFGEDQFDAIVMTHVIEHVHNPSELLSQCFKILRPGGILSVQTPNSESWGHRRFGADWFALEPPRHLMLFTSASLRCVVERAGLQVKDLHTSVHIAPFIWLQSRAIQCRGKADFISRPGRRSKLGALSFQLAERALINLRPDAGEELVLVGQKPTA